MAALAALLALPALEAIFFFVISGGEQSVRGGLNPGHVEKYLGIWFWLASWTTALVALDGVAVLFIARMARRFSTLFIVAVSVPVAIVTGVLFLAFTGSDSPFAIGVWIVFALCGAVASLTFCSVAGIRWRLSAAE